MSLSTQQLIDKIMEQAKEKKWGIKPEDISVPEKIALIHSEVSEAYEAYRNNNIEDKHGFKEELGDIIHRVFHLCGIFDIDIEKQILKKIEINKNREWDKLNKKRS